jgi:predicted fused transcriptional regulator/phosphomethylpyrimidine kinase
MGWVPGCYYLGRDEEDVVKKILKILRDFQKEPFW